MPDILEYMVYTSGLSRELTDHSLWPLFIVDRYNLHCWCLLYNLFFFYCLLRYELGRQPANTKLSSNKTVRRIRVRGGNVKWRALRLDTGNYSWGSEAVTRKTRILDVVYNASNNELVRTQTLVKSAIVQVDAAPFKQWYLQHYGVDIGRKKKAVTKKETTEVNDFHFLFTKPILKLDFWTCLLVLLAIHICNGWLYLLISHIKSERYMWLFLRIILLHSLSAYLTSVGHA